MDDAAIEELLRNLGRAPLGLSRDDDFRISIAGAQEKTALLWDGQCWRKPLGTTPTTHILKPPIGELPNGINLSNRVANEFHCLRLLSAFGLPVDDAAVKTFGETTTLVIECFDRHWTRNGRLLRLPQEDCCQALSIPPGEKYQSEGGPGLVQILNLPKGSDTPDKDRRTVLKAQILFWLIGATDGHAKNFSIFLGPGGSFRLTPLDDILSVQPGLDALEIERQRMKLAMAVGATHHYRIEGIQGRHFIETGKAAGLSKATVQTVVEEVGAAVAVDRVLERLADELPSRFPKSIHVSGSRSVIARLRSLARGV